MHPIWACGLAGLGAYLAALADTSINLMSWRERSSSC
jgi:hypothetical protein